VNGLARVASRAALALVFFILGFMSLWAWAVVDERLCARFPALCRATARTCTEIDRCPMGALLVAKLIAVYLGPPIVFMIVAFTFSKKNRKLLDWCSLAVALVLAHGLAMLFVRLAHV
jgi:hypothetical protein